MWLALAFLSAFFLGCYDVNKKMSVQNNAVIPVLFLNTFFCTLFFLPLFLLSRFVPDLVAGSIFYVPAIDAETHFYIVLKSALVLSSWIFSYFAIKHLPLTISGPINATRPVMTLLGALLIFGERLNLYQWIGVLLTIISVFLLSATGRKEGINFRRNKWIIFMFLAAALGAASGLYDKFLMQRFSSTSVQFWYNFYQFLMMAIVLIVLWYPRRGKSTPFKWKWNILLVSFFLTLADFVYFYALTDPEAMISIVSMVRRSSVVVSFIGGVLFFHEKNLKGKAIDLALIIIGMFFLYLGTK
ncbi:EamA family transporter [Dysgonomonas sp. 520]|uniref:EamA family transporter n=1 Tax=Dysgonomonas sp. 520 TaxID=2302931 RepID=UPI0013CF729A|nr:EamA family transporter [Dysgonomonas sp. 520]NDW10227.1 EamA family transporter [Dysgonomonas sp. 520]